MKGQALDTIFMIIVGILLTLGFIYAIVANVPMVSDFVKKNLKTVQTATSDFLSGGQCGGIPEACREWTYDGLGLSYTYKESGVNVAAAGCGIKSSVCPTIALHRISVKDCLEMCVKVVDCEGAYQDLGFSDVTSCYEDAKSGYTGGGT